MKAQNPGGPLSLSGRIQAGTGQAAHWLGLFNAAYARKTGMPVFPGSLNVSLDQPFDWFDHRWHDGIVWFGREEYGGERDILLLRCALSVDPNLPACLWSTTNAARDPADRKLAEILAPVNLRATYGLMDGDAIRIELLLKALSGAHRFPAG